MLLPALWAFGPSLPLNLQCGSGGAANLHHYRNITLTVAYVPFAFVKVTV